MKARIQVTTLISEGRQADMEVAARKIGGRESVVYSDPDLAITSFC
jgi:hypothetical protein